MEEIVEMSKKEIERIQVLSQVRDKMLTQDLAAKKLGITDRHVRNLLMQIRTEGNKGIISKKRGKPSNNQLKTDIREKALKLVRDHYTDFGPKLANEYLRKAHYIRISTETLRQWMIKSHFWIPRNSQCKKIHLPRERRRAFGELIQVDGSHHAWFEDRASPCVLMVFIDDATSMITSMYFAETESLEAYYQTLKRHIEVYGVPLGIYGDRCSVLVPRQPKDSKDQTQFQKALKELDIELILALSPQAKGRVERANRTLQDRLVKELRLKGISSIEEGNAMLEEYRQNYNKLFSKKPSEQANAHRPLEGICLEQVLCTRQTRTLSKDFIVQFENTFYQISHQQKSVHLYKGGKIEIRELLGGNKVALFGGKEVIMKRLCDVESPVLNEKEVVQWKPIQRYIPAITHPFKHNLLRNKIREDMLMNVI